MSKNANKAALDEIVATTPAADNAPAVEEASAAVEPPAKDDPREYVEFKLPRDPRTCGSARCRRPSSGAARR